jgi:hypothetical protein
MNNKEEIQQAIQEGTMLWQSIVETQNNIILEEGSILKDDKRIWSPYAHTWDNQDWVKILLALKAADREHGLMGVELDHIDLIQEVIIKGWDYDNRILDKRNNEHKSKTWKMMMMLREIWNRIHKINVKTINRVSTKYDSVKNRPITKTSTFHTLFKNN